ncbi:amidase [Veronia pacifica]|uniref:Amidase n=1 Tax=Veronia pacifica TaxID=1080227 RepID=A0A1C3EIF6_9GAMM|nr:amidase [Veronia pacifica]ODA33010.1 amidase [Veronia pacifica]
MDRSTESSDLSHSPVNVEEMTLDMMAALMREGKISSESLVTQYIERIHQIDKTGPSLHSVLVVNPHAIDEARALDVLWNSEKPLGPLHGVPVLIKDNIETAGPMPTTAGALALKNNVCLQDSPLVAQLRKAGAVILGKANLSEWANFKSLKSSSGFSELGGQTKNPYFLDRNPCGSSSGSAVSVSANLTTVAVGTETDGSIVAPASHCGIVGMKPTVGLVPSKGIIPISHNQDSAGPMARTVMDTALLLNALVDPSHSKARKDYAASLQFASLEGKRIGIPQHADRFPESVRAVFEAAVGKMEQAGAEIIRGLELPQEDSLGEAEFEILLYDFKHDLSEYLSGTSSSVEVKNIDELVAFNLANPSTLALFNQELIEMAAKKGSVEEPAYQASRQLVEKYGRKQGIDALSTDYQLDALIAPTNTPSWLIDHENGDNFEGGSSSPSAITGYPIITVPMGDTQGLPLGLSFFSGAYQEQTLLELAYCFERLINARKMPEFIAVHPSSRK